MRIIDCIRRVLCVSGAVPDALEKLSARRFQALIDMCMRDYDITLIDTPPSNQYADVLRVAAATGYALIVARKHVTFMQDVDALTAQLNASQVSVAGMLLNDYLAWEKLPLFGPSRQENRMANA